MFELETLERTIKGHKVTIKELDYLDEADFRCHWSDILEIGIKIEQLKEDRKHKETQDLILEYRSIMVKAFSIPNILVDGEECDTRVFIKKIGEVECMQIYRDLLQLGHMSEEEEKK